MPSIGDSLPPHQAWIERPDKSTFVLAGDCHFGRSEGNEISDPDVRISRRHAVVRRESNHFVLVDLGSTNGTFLNDVRISKPTRLKDGDTILVGALRCTFCQPHESTEIDTSDSIVGGRTVVSVGKVSCWMLLAVPPAARSTAGDAWIDRVRQELTAGGAGVKRLDSGALLAHWRDRSGVAEKVRSLALGLSRLSLPAGARLVLHHGAVRVGPGSNPAEENLLGADVAFLHRLEATAAGLGVGTVLSDTVVRSLAPFPHVKSLGVQAVQDLPGQHALHTFAGD